MVFPNKALEIRQYTVAPLPKSAGKEAINYSLSKNN